jgi:5-hydroxydodecatetraenal polyketide synthase CpkA
MTGHLRDADLARLRQRGLRAMSEAEGLALFDAALAVPRAYVVAVALDRVAPRPTADGAAELRARLAALDRDEQRRHVLDVLGVHVAEVLGHAEGRHIDPHRTFRDLGFDSLTAVELRNTLSSVTGTRLPATVVFEHPTPAALADHIYRTVIAVPPHRAARHDPEELIEAMDTEQLIEAALGATQHRVPRSEPR